jgi:branched-chain amino acid transport system substrate-binding protein
MKTSNFAFLIATLFLFGCSAVQKRQAAVSPPSAAQSFSIADQDFKKGNYRKAIERADKIQLQYAGTDIVDRCMNLKGQSHLKLKEYDRALMNFNALLNLETSSNLEPFAHVGAATSLFRLERYEDAIKQATIGLANNPGANEALALHRIRLACHEFVSAPMVHAESLSYLAQNTDNSEEKSRYLARLKSFVVNGLSEDQLITLGSRNRDPLLKTFCAFRIGEIKFASGSFESAKSYLSEVVQSPLAMDVHPAASNMLQQIESRQSVAPFTIGTVLPLTGKHAVIGEKTLRGLKMGLGLVGGGNSDFKLAIMDSESNPELARKGVERLMIEDNVIAVVGDLSSKTSELAAQKSNEIGIPIIGLSQKSNLPQIGEFVFQNSLTSKNIVATLVYTAMEKYGMKRFAIIYPNDPYGIEFTNLFWEEVKLRGGQIVAAQTYSSTEKDFAGPVARVANTFYLEDRQAEYTYLLNDWYKSQKVISTRISPPTDLLPPQIDFDAIFIPDSVKAMGQISSMLTFNNVSDIKLLGTNIWNQTNLVERGGKLIDGALFVDGASSVDSGFQNSSFAREYQKIFDETPGVFELQGYDTGRLLRTLVERGARTRLDLRNALASTKNFAGGFGVIDVNAQREFSRPMAVLTVENGKVTQANLRNPSAEDSTNE